MIVKLCMLLFTLFRPNMIVKLSKKDSDERNELDALRLENDMLRRHLGSLEDKVQRAEENTMSQGHAVTSVGIEMKPSMASTCGMSMSTSMCGTEKDSPPEVRQLHGILQWLDVRSIDAYQVSLIFPTECLIQTSSYS